MAHLKFIKKSAKIVCPAQAAYEAYPPGCNVPWDDLSDTRRRWWGFVVESVILHNLPRQKHEFRLHPFLEKDQSMVLSGMENGAAARAQFKLDDIPSYEDVGIVVPDTVISFNRSFFRGLFEPTIKKHGVDSFKNQFTIYSIQDAVREDFEHGLRPYESFLELIQTP